MIYKGTLSFYRRLLKTLMKVFENDFENFHKTRIEAKRMIKQNSQLEDEMEILDKIYEGEEAREFLLKNVMQANLQDSGVYRVKVRKEHTIGAKKLQLIS